MNITNRLAWREVTAHKGRSWLIAVLIALPVLVASGTSVWFATQSGTPEQAVAGSLGRTAMSISLDPWADDDATAAMAAAVAELDGITEQIGLVAGQVRGRDVEFGLATVDATHYQLEGRWLVRGETSGNHVLLTAPLLDELGLHAGDAVTLAGAEYPIGGTFAVANLYWPGVAGVLVAPSHPLAQPGAQTLYLPQPLSGPEVDALETAGLAVTDVADVMTVATNSGEGFAQTGIALVLTSLGALVVASVAAAAFTISIRQMRRALALLSATGAAPKMLTRILVRQGVFLGVLGAVLGTVVGVLLGAGLAWWQDVLDPRPSFGIVFRWGALAMFVGLGVLASRLAVWFPSRGVARQDALAVLGDGETTMHEPRVPWVALAPLALGASMLAVGGWQGRLRAPLNDGTEMQWIVTSSAVTMVLWFVAAALAAPWLVERLSRWVPQRSTAWRLAMRDAARSGRRSVALVVASASVVALGAWAMTYIAAAGNHEIETYRINTQVGVARVILDPTDGSDFSGGRQRAAAVAEVLGTPGATLEVSAPSIFMSEARTNWWIWPNTDGVPGGIVVGGVEELAFILGEAPPAGLVAALDSGQAVVFDDNFIDDGQVQVHEEGMVDGVDVSAQHELGAVLAPTVPGVETVISPSTAAELGMEVQPSAIWMDYPEILTSAEEGVAASAVRNLGGNYHLAYERGTHSQAHAFLPWILLVVALLASAIGVVGMVLALNEGRSTRGSLATIGATTGLLRRVAVAQAVVCVALGGAVGAVTGALPATISFAASTLGMGALPWPQLVALALVPVVVVAAAAAAFVRPVRGQAVRAD